MGRLAQEATVRTATAPTATGRRAMARGGRREKENDGSNDAFRPSCLLAANIATASHFSAARAGYVKAERSDTAATARRGPERERATLSSNCGPARNRCVRRRSSSR